MWQFFLSEWQGRNDKVISFATHEKKGTRGFIERRKHRSPYRELCGQRIGFVDLEVCDRQWLVGQLALVPFGSLSLQTVLAHLWVQRCVFSIAIVWCVLVGHQGDMGGVRTHVVGRS